MRPLTIRSLLLAPLLVSLAFVACSDETTQPDPNPNPAVVGPLGEREDLPVDETINIENLSAPVDIVRDKYGRPHIYASSLTDAVRAQGYIIARDRHLQLEFFRRLSEGRLAEVLGASEKSTIDLDITYRHIGLGRVAKAQYEAMAEGSEARAILDAYADGVSQVFRQIRSGDMHLPQGIFGIDTQAFTDWSGVDSLAIARLQTFLLSYSADLELEVNSLMESARSTFVINSPDLGLAKRAGLERDLLRFAPSMTATTTTGYPMISQKSVKNPAPNPLASAAFAGLAGYRKAMQHSRELLNPDGFGSNNWAVAPQHSQSGFAMVASDPHLPLSAPAIFWPVSVDVTVPEGGDTSLNAKFAGVAFPGIPGIILGHNEHLGWGSTVAMYDVADVYSETLTPDGSSVVFKGNNVPIETIDEVINIQGGSPYTYSLKVVPHHGPIFPTILPDHTVAPIDPQLGAFSVRWTGHEPTTEFEAVLKLLRSKDVDEAREALKGFGVGAQNWMLADTAGNILWTSHANVPMRDPKAFQWDPNAYTGTIPCLVLPGNGVAEWNGYLNDDLVPWEKNPAAGFIATANNDPIGNTLDNDPTNDTLPDGTPMYLACVYDTGFREAQIQKRISGAANPLSHEDMSDIQGDVHSALGEALSAALIDAIDRAEEELSTPGSHPELTALVKDPSYSSDWAKKTRDLLAAWGTDANYRAASGIDPETNMPISESADPVEAKAAQATLIFNTWFVKLLKRTLADELGKLDGSLPRDLVARALLRLITSDPTKLVTYDPGMQDSILWDDLGTPEIETRYERMIRALLDAHDYLNTAVGTDPADYRWGAFHTTKFTALISLFGEMSIPPSSDTTFTKGFPRHGDSFSVDASGYSFNIFANEPNFTYNHGPVQRFVIEMDPAGPKVYNAIPGGNVWDPASPHFRDEAEYWRKNQAHAVPFLLPDVIANKENRTVAASKAP